MHTSGDLDSATGVGRPAAAREARMLAGLVAAEARATAGLADPSWRGSAAKNFDASVGWLRDDLLRAMQLLDRSSELLELAPR